jgi:S-adenosylmethionine:tRNA ribosyltransferase-isomerase
MSAEDLASGYAFDLPDELIAQAPAPRRDASRLMVVGTDTYAHATFADIGTYLRSGDLLILNETRVIAARIFGSRESGGRVELLLLHPARSLRYDPRADRWIALVKPARRLKVGTVVTFGDLGRATIVAEEDAGLRELHFELNVGFEDFLERAGTLPLPPYIHNTTADAKERYQTVFARVPGSVAAPTASLHYTTELLGSLEAAGVEIVRITLDVGLGTFRPMTAERLDDHVMHAESYTITPQAADRISRARAHGRRIVAAGTTVVRALEGNIHSYGRIVPGDGTTDIFIRPGHSFAVVDAMITNFHLPHSTLLVLVSAFAGRERVLAAYREAVAQRYRFFSFGDAMMLEVQRP